MTAILVDIDSTLHPAHVGFRKHLAARHGIQLAEADLNRWDFWQDHGLSLTEWLDLVREAFHADEEILAAVPYPGAVDVLNDWQESRGTIHVVSDREERRLPATAAWLDAIGLTPDVLVIRDAINKLAYAEAHGIDLVIDDKPALIEACVRAGMPVATLVQPYNADLLAREPDVIRGRDWPELAVAIGQVFPELARS